MRISQLFSALVLTGVCSLPFVPVFAYAQIDNGAADTVASNAGFSSMSVYEILGTLINVFLGLLGVVFLLLVLYAGFLWMTAGGDDKQVDKAKKILINATVGLVITLSAFAITTFIVNWISDATGVGGDGSSANGGVSVERLSGSLGSGALRDHYPLRNATDVARNTSIIVTFRDAMNIESFIDGYDTAGTPTDVSNDTVATAILSDNISIYQTANGIETALTDVSVAFSDDLKTFVFDPATYLGSSTESVSYTVFLSPNILDANDEAVFTGSESSGYEWSFETGTTIDSTPPTVQSIVPAAGGTYARNITVQITFDEAVDPTTASGIRTASGDYDTIQTYGLDEVPLEGTYEISNGYTTVTFTPVDDCGTNSCGETMYCLPASESMGVNVAAATPGTSPPQVDVYPYDGIADVSANALDGNGDGTSGDDYSWTFTTTSATELGGAAIISITPDISEESVSLDQTISILFDDVMLANTITSDEIILTNTELSTETSHEMWYRFSSTALDASSTEVTSDTQAQTQTLVEVSHGTFLESLDGKTYVYGVTVGDGVKNQYQNCFAPAEGPSDTGGICTGPYCCNGVASSTACTLF
ncbi:MAG: Ig-like domain-containing protein [Patescibacteria group bacterium]